jgi:hypothetical protein
LGLLRGLADCDAEARQEGGAELIRRASRRVALQVRVVVSQDVAHAKS